MRSLGTRFFCAPNNIFCTADNLLCMHVLRCAPTKRYFRKEGKLRVYSNRHQPRAQSGYPDCFYRERNNRLVSSLPRTKQQDNFQLTVFESNEHSVCWSKTTRLLANILIGTSRLNIQEWRFCKDYPDTFKYPQNGRNFHNFDNLSA